MIAVDVVVPVRTSSTNSKLRNHWRVNRKTSKEERQATALMLRSKQPAGPVYGVIVPADLAVVVTLTRLSERLLDDDNCAGALKAIRDEVAAWLGMDDGDPRVTWRYDQKKQPRGHFGVRVVVETLDLNVHP